MAYAYTVSRQQETLTDDTPTTIATSTDSAKHLVIVNGQIFNGGATSEEVHLTFDGSDDNVEWKVLLGGTVGAGCNLPLLVADVGSDVKAFISDASGTVETSVQYVEVTPFEAMQLLHGGSRLA